MKIATKRAAALAWLLLFAGAIAGCSGGASPEQQLRARAEQYWKARQDVDMHTVFKMESEARPRGDLTEQAASSIGSGFRLRGVSIKEVSVDGDEGEVVVEARVQVIAVPGLSGRSFEQKTRDYWVRIDGEWYHKTYMGPNKGFGGKAGKEG